MPGPDFDDELRGLADAAASTSRPLAPEEVRRRGSARRTRRTIAGALAAALVVGGIGAAALAGPGQGDPGTGVAAPSNVDVTSTFSPRPSDPAASPPASSRPTDSTGSTQQPSPTGVGSNKPADPRHDPTPGTTSDGEPRRDPPQGDNPTAQPVADPLGPGVVAATPTPPPGDSAEEAAARTAMLTTSELPSGSAWSNAPATPRVNCAPYTIPGFESVTREDRYSTDGDGTSAWQEILLPASSTDAAALYDARASSAAACSPSNVREQWSLDGDPSAMYTYSTECLPDKATCGDFAFVVGVARVGNTIVYFQFSNDEDVLDPQSIRQRMTTVISRVRNSPLLG